MEELKARGKGFRSWPLLLISLFLVCTIVYVFRLGADARRQEELGRQAVMLLYNYNSLGEFDSNIGEFERIVTPEVFSRMTANNSDRILSVYLKLRAKPCLVNIIESAHNYVVYSLVSEAIEPERVFIFSFTTFADKINTVKEGELIVFQTTVGWVPDLDKLPETPTEFEAIPELPVPTE